MLSKGIGLLVALGVTPWAIVSCPVAWAGPGGNINRAYATIRVLAEVISRRGLRPTTAISLLKRTARTGTANMVDGTWVAQVATPPSVDPLWASG